MYYSTKNDLVKGQLFMLCLGGQALAVAEQLEEVKHAQQKFSELKAHLEVVFITTANKESKMVEFENRFQRIEESEDEFMLNLVKIYIAANPDASEATSTLAIKRKFIHGISSDLCRSTYIFCSRFIPDFNHSLPPLYDLTRKNVPFNWTLECQNAFDYVKNKPVLRSSNTSDTFILEMDASDRGIGCFLKGITVNGEEFIVSYYSAKLTDTEFLWNMVEKEAYAILKAIEKFSHYLIGKPFILKTDNLVLTYLLSTHMSKSRKLLNWALKLSESKNNGISDCLSRLHENINTIFEIGPVLSHSEILDSQMKNECMKHAISYLHSKFNSDID